MNKLYCTICPNTCLLTIIGAGLTLTVEGAGCEKGREYALSEPDDPDRILTTTVRTRFPDVPVISVRTDSQIPLSSFDRVLAEINDTVVDTELGCGDILIENAADTGVNVIITSPALMQIGAEYENNNTKLNRFEVPSRDGGSFGGQGGTGSVRNAVGGGVLDDMGEDYLGGVVGAAGEAVGVEDAEAEDAAPAAAEDGKEIRKQSRPHIRR